MAYLQIRCSCSCGWRGYENELEWFPFNPIEEFIGVDKRNDVNNVIKFRKLCPNCKSSEKVILEVE